jgi:hypothetical protein
MGRNMSKSNNSQMMENSQISQYDIRLLVSACAEFVTICATITGKIDPAAAKMLTFVSDSILIENKTGAPSVRKKI